MGRAPAREDGGVRAAWSRTPAPARACLALCVLVGLFGLYQIGVIARHQLRVAHGYAQQYIQRLDYWWPIYGFAVSCAPRVAPGTSVLLVDPTDLQTASGTDSALPGADTGNLSTFVYVLYPRTVRPLGQVPPGWTPAAAGADYVALWQQTSTRSPAARAAAAAVADALARDLPGERVCGYADGANDRGGLYAVSARARAALAAPAPPPPGVDAITPAQAAATLSPLAYLRTWLGLAALWVLGALLLLALGGRALAPRLLAALALPAGCVAIALALLVTSLLGLPWSLAWLALPWLLAAVAALWRHRARLTLRPPGRAPAPAADRAARPHLAVDERLAVALLAALALLAIALAPFGLPGSDGFDLYYSKARIFFHDGGVAPYYAHAAALAYSLPGHPPLISLDVTWLYLVIGRIDEHTTLLLWPALYASLLAAFYAFARAAATRRVTLWTTVGLAVLMPELTHDAIGPGGFCDMPLALLLLGGCGALWRWAATGSRAPGPLLVAGFFLAGAALTKEEGLPAALIALLASPLLAWRAAARPRWWAPAAWGGPVFALGLLPWAWVRLTYRLPEVSVSVAGRSLSVLVERLFTAAVGLAGAAVSGWLAPLAVLAAWLVVLALAARGARRAAPAVTAPGGRAIFLAVIVAGQLAADAAGIALNPLAIRYEISSTSGRFLMQLGPLVFLLVADAWRSLAARPAQQPALSPAPAAIRAR